MPNLVVNTTGVNLGGSRGARELVDTFYQVNGTPFGTGVAATESTQPKVVGGAILAKGGSTSTSFSNLDGLTLGQNNRSGMAPYRGFTNGVVSAIISGTSQYGTVATCSGGFVNISTELIKQHGFIAGTKVLLSPSGNTAVAPGSGRNSLYGTVTVTLVGTGTFNCNMPLTVLTTGYIGAQLQMQALSDTPTFANINKGQYIAARAGYTIAGVASNAMKFMARDTTNACSIHKRDAYRVTKITTALRAGSYNRYTGKWLALPTIANDATAVSSMGATSDHAANVTPRSATVGSGGSQTTIGPGELVYKSGRPKAFGTADGATYSAKTT
jgi:hypothetical protein